MEGKGEGREEGGRTTRITENFKHMFVNGEYRNVSNMMM